MATLCGCYYIARCQAQSINKYLPRIDVSARSTIFSTASKTVLSQTFINPSSRHEVPECKYVFPLYSGVSVVGFTCQVGSRTITGRVKEKVKAKEVYNEAKSRGQTAGLLEQGPTSDVFITSLGNIPAGEKVLVKITYIGELKHDIGADGIRFTMPTKISPRYGSAEVDLPDQSLGVSAGGLTITVDINMEADSPLQEVRSQSHPIAVTLGRISTATSDSHSFSHASAALSLGDAALEKDFILEIQYKNSGKPRALLETHPTITGQRALLTTLMPKASLKLSKPEVIFVADQSGSMQGARTQTLIAALKVFLKSLPVGIKFNICFFGTKHSFLFTKSQEYNEDSLQKAMDSLKGLDGQYGGTETLTAIRNSIESRNPEENLSLILATDGDIWQQQELFDYLNISVSQSKKALRLFALGIGDSVSSALIDGVAKAGNGFAQSVANGEKLDSKVIRMLKGALTPNSGTYSLEVQYEKEEEDFVFVERVKDSLRVLTIDDDISQNEHKERELKSSAQAVEFSTRGARHDANIDDDQARFKDLPAIVQPKLLQTPQAIPPLYPLCRTTVYLLLSPEASQATPKSVILRNDSVDDPFEMEIPVEILAQPSETIHQIAAKKAISELEEGRGWLKQAAAATGTLLKEQYRDQFDLLVEREAIRLGVQYQIAGKHTSFVAVQSTSEESAKYDDSVSIREDTSLQIGITKGSTAFSQAIGYAYPRGTSLFSGNIVPFGAPVLFSNAPPTAFSQPIAHAYPRGTSLFGGNSVPHSGSALFSNIPPTADSYVRRENLRELAATSWPPASSMSSTREEFETEDDSVDSSEEEDEGFGCFSVRRAEGDEAEGVAESVEMECSDDGEAEGVAESVETDPLQKIIALQTFEGYWDLDSALSDAIGRSLAQCQLSSFEEDDLKVWGTILAVTFLEKKMAAEKEAWEMVVDKAKAWLATQNDANEGKFWQLAAVVIDKA